MWRDSKTIPTGINGPYTCGAVNRPAWFPLNQTDAVAFDEMENPQDLCFTGDVVSPPLGGTQTCFPLEAQRVHLAGGNVIGSDPTPASDFGWIYLNLKQPTRARPQFEQALALNPELQGAKDGLAVIEGQ